MYNFFEAYNVAICRVIPIKYTGKHCEIAQDCQSIIDELHKLLRTSETHSDLYFNTVRILSCRFRDGFRQAFTSLLPCLRLCGHRKSSRSCDTAARSGLIGFDSERGGGTGLVIRHHHHLHVTANTSVSYAYRHCKLSQQQQQQQHRRGNGGMTSAAADFNGCASGAAASSTTPTGDRLFTYTFATRHVAATPDLSVALTSLADDDVSKT
jgi:hypothetical protein